MGARRLTEETFDALNAEYEATGGRDVADLLAKYGVAKQTFYTERRRRNLPPVTKRGPKIVNSRQAADAMAEAATFLVGRIGQLERQLADLGARPDREDHIPTQLPHAVLLTLCDRLADIDTAADVSGVEAALRGPLRAFTADLALLPPTSLQLLLLECADVLAAAERLETDELPALAVVYGTTDSARAAIGDCMRGMPPRPWSDVMAALVRKVRDTRSGASPPAFLRSWTRRGGALSARMEGGQKDGVSTTWQPPQGPASAGPLAEPVPVPGFDWLVTPADDAE
jgi:hypothetical protein